MYKLQKNLIQVKTLSQITLKNSTQTGLKGYCSISDTPSRSIKEVNNLSFDALLEI